MRSLRHKILAAAAALVLASQAGTIAMVLLTAKNDVAGRAARSLTTGSEVFRNATESRAAQLANTVRALAADYGFKQAVGTAETATIDSALVNQARRAGADIAFIIDTERRLLAADGTALAAEAAVDAALFEQGFGAAGRQVLATPVGAFEVFTVPVKAPVTIAWLSMGFRLDQQFARRMHELAGLEVSFIANTTGGQTLITTSEPAHADGLLRLLGSQLLPGASPATVRIGADPHLAISAPFVTGSDTVTVLLTKSLAEAMAPFELLKSASLVLGALLLLAALAGAILLSRALTKPVNLLADAVQRMQSGDYSTPVEIRSGDEFSAFGTAFNAMQDEIAAREQRIIHQARHDSLTGLYNADYALERLNQLVSEAWNSNRTVGLLIVRLGSVNALASSFGHELAESYLVEVAQRLQRLVDSSYLLARLENDDFLIALQEDEDVRTRDVAGDLQTHLGTAVRLPSINVHVDPAIGIALFPRHANNANNLLLRANIALSEAVAESRPIRLYREGDQEKRVRNMELLQDLPRATENNELQLYCQPKIDLRDETICGGEALVRWDHSRFGWLPPGEFIPLIEKSGNISMLTRWVIRRSARQLAAWQAAGLDFTMSVNLSAIDLLDNELPWFVLDVVREYGIDPQRFIFEITEEAMVRDFARANSSLNRYSDLGIALSIDDFGTGYSSLAQLKMLPVNELKIDRTFILGLPNDSADAAIVAAAVELAQKLGLKLVAEGVSSGAACRWLQARGVQQAQGFYWSEPIPAESFAQWADGFAGGATRLVKPLTVT